MRERYRTPSTRVPRVVRACVHPAHVTPARSVIIRARGVSLIVLLTLSLFLSPFPNVLFSSSSRNLVVLQYFPVLRAGDSISLPYERTVPISVICFLRVACFVSSAPRLN